MNVTYFLPFYNVIPGAFIVTSGVHSVPLRALFWTVVPRGPGQPPVPGPLLVPTKLQRSSTLPLSLD